MTQENIKTRVVGVDIKLERTTIAIVDVRGNVISKSDLENSMRYRFMLRNYKKRINIP